jgi:photosystem II stability/assembly factor-like uncharacterized protein
LQTPRFREPGLQSETENPHPLHFLWSSEALAIEFAASMFPMIFCGWILRTPLDPHEAAVTAKFFYPLAALCAVLLVAIVYRLVFAKAPFYRRPSSVLVAAVILAGAAVLVDTYRWDIRMAGIPRADDLRIDTRGFQIEKLPFPFRVSFAQGPIVYFADAGGEVYRAEDSNPMRTLRKIGRSGVMPRSLIVSSKGTIFVSGDRQPLFRSIDGGRTWEKVLDIPVWRMAEDEISGALYAGNYSKGPGVHAVVFKSDDDGHAWRQIFADGRLDHIHTLRFDPRFHRLYIATGDGGRRGQAYTDDGGRSWCWMLQGDKQGYTDAALSRSFILWGSDDRLGRIVIASRSSPGGGRTILWSKGRQVWFVTGRDEQIYAGTFVEDRWNRSAVYFLASSDEGRSWQKLLQSGAQPGPKGFITDSRHLSAGGWLYFTDGNGQGYRVRKLPNGG